MISKNRILDIKKSRFWYQEMEFLIFTIYVSFNSSYLDQGKTDRLTKFISPFIFMRRLLLFIQHFLISRIIFLDIKKCISWFQEFDFLISRNNTHFLKSNNRIPDIKKSFLVDSKCIQYGNVFGPPFVDLFTYWARNNVDIFKFSTKTRKMYVDFLKYFFFFRVYFGAIRNYVVIGIAT